MEKIFNQAIETINNEGDQRCYVAIDMTESEIKEFIGYFSYYDIGRFYKSEFSHLEKFIGYFIDYCDGKKGLYRIDGCEYGDGEGFIISGDRVSEVIKTTYRFVKLN